MPNEAPSRNWGRQRQGKEVAYPAWMDNDTIATEEVHDVVNNAITNAVDRISNNSSDDIDYNTQINNEPETTIHDDLESTATEQSNANKDGPENLPVGNWGSSYHDDLLTPAGSVEDEPRAVVDKGKKASDEDEPEPLFSGSRKTVEVKNTSRLENCIAGSCDLCRATAPHESALPSSQRGQKTTRPGQTKLCVADLMEDVRAGSGSNWLDYDPRLIYGGKGSMSGPSGLGYSSSFPQDNPIGQSIRDPARRRTIRAGSRDQAAFHADLQVAGSKAFQLDSRFRAEFERDCRRASRMHDARVRELGGPSAGDTYQGNFGHHDSGDGVSEVSSAEMQQAERIALERKLMAKEGSFGSVSSIDGDGRDNIRRAQWIKKEQRKARERERRGGLRYPLQYTQTASDYAYHLDRETRSFYGTDVPTLRAENDAFADVLSLSMARNEFELRDEDTDDTVSEVSFVEIDEAEDKAWREKMLGSYTYGPPRPMSPFNEAGFANIRRDQKAKKKERRAREKGRRKSHGMPSSGTAFPTPPYAQDIYANLPPFNRTRRQLDAISPYDIPIGDYGINVFDIHHAIGSRPSRMTSGTRHFDNDEITSTLRDLYGRIR
ncbi:hypothetical protein LTR15_011727 [Elasticomyces elasticus]|nr:hypothetical protein LTR15_011727 [Elasticomyces elasticus]